MFRDTITGLDKIFYSDIPKGSIVLVVGKEGTLKSTFVFSIVSNYLRFSGGHGLYITLEQTRESHLRNMESIGLKGSDALEIFDCRDMRREWEDSEPDLFKTIEEVLLYYLDKYSDLAVFVLDSLSALRALCKEENPRSSMYHFFSRLREKDLTSFLIAEENYAGHHESVTGRSRSEFFLADGLIELGAIENVEDVKRYIQIRKMRATKHSMEKHQLIVGKDGLEILGKIY